LFVGAHSIITFWLGFCFGYARCFAAIQIRHILCSIIQSIDEQMPVAYYNIRQTNVLRYSVRVRNNF